MQIEKRVYSLAVAMFLVANITGAVNFMVRRVVDMDPVQDQPTPAAVDWSWILRPPPPTLVPHTPCPPHVHWLPDPDGCPVVLR